MNCTVCKRIEISPNIEPFGGYLCSNGHLQCTECNTSSKCYCGKCKADTKFLHMQFKSTSIEPAPIEATPRLKENAFLRKTIFDEIETQSRLSEEHLSMKDSGECIGENVKVSSNKDEAFVKGDIKENCVEEPNGSKMVLVVTRQTENSGPLMGHSSDGHDFEQSLKADKLAKVDNISKSSQKEPNDSKVKYTSEVGSMVSTSTSGNPSSNLKHQEMATDSCSRFDYQNSTAKMEIVYNYVENCRKTASLYDSLPLNCQLLNSQLEPLPIKQKLELTEERVGVPTGADSCLKLILNDGRMKKILETRKEDIKIPKLEEKCLLIKIPTEGKSAKQEKAHTEINLKIEKSNAHRAYYNAPNPVTAPVNNLHCLPEPQSAQQEPPLPQYQNIPCYKALAQIKQTNVSKIKPVPVYLLNICRSPIQCPESICQRLIFVSDFCKHLVVDHNHLPMERISPFQCKNFFLDARLFYTRSSKCHMVYLMCDKISNLGSSEYKDFLPLLVMTSRITLNQMCHFGDQTTNVEYFLLWATCIASEELPLSATLTVWPRSRGIPYCHVVYSGQMYSIRNSQNPIDVWRSGRMLLLTSQQIKAFTNNGKEMMNLQLSVH